MKYLEYLKEAWKDTRKRAIIKLGLYIAFFVIMFAIAGISSGNHVPEVLEPEKEVISYDNYSFVLNSNNEKVLNGVFDNNIITYNFSNQIYLLENKILYQVINNELVSIDNTHTKLDKLVINKIDDYIDKSVEIYKTEYKDGKEKVGYEISVSDFTYIYEEKEIIDNNKIEISITYFEDRIIEIEYDLSNYYKVNNYRLSLVFDSFNEAESLY